jgi:hypothetical protein
MRLLSMLSETGDGYRRFANAAAASTDAPILDSFTPPHPWPTQWIVDASAARIDARTPCIVGRMYHIPNLKAARQTLISA